MAITIRLKRLVRGVQHLLNFVFREYPRGLDFSLRNKFSGIGLPGNHGYALTSRSALRDMLTEIPYPGRPFLDIGSGKGGAVVFAHELGCGKSAGIEYENHLHVIAEKNIEIMNLADSCRSFNLDARAFSRYADYDIYFLFNPFDDDIYVDVIHAIVAQNLARRPPGTKYLICYGGANIEAVTSHECFSLIKEGTCRHRLNHFRIFEMRTAQ